MPYVTLTAAGAPFEVHPLNFRKSQHMTPDYLRLNPKHKVPVLVIDGAPLTENVAIQIWISRHFPAAKLLPADPMQELHAISLLAWCASGIHPFLSRINSPPRVCDLPGAEEPGNGERDDKGPSTACLHGGHVECEFGRGSGHCAKIRWGPQSASPG